MTTRANRSSTPVVSTSALPPKPSSIRRRSTGQTYAATTEKSASVSTATLKACSSLSSTPSGKPDLGSSQPGRQTSVRYKITPDGSLLKETSSHQWIVSTPRVDFLRLDATTDNDIDRQKLIYLVDEALRTSMGSVTALAKDLYLSPSTICRWRRGINVPTATNMVKLQQRLTYSALLN